MHEGGGRWVGSNKVVEQKKKESSNSPETKLKVTEYCYLIDRDFKIPVMKKLSELQENSERQFGKLRNKNNEQKEYQGN